MNVLNTFLGVVSAIVFFACRGSAAGLPSIPLRESNAGRVIAASHVREPIVYGDAPEAAQTVAQPGAVQTAAPAVDGTGVNASQTEVGVGSPAVAQSGSLAPDPVVAAVGIPAQPEVGAAMVNVPAQPDVVAPSVATMQPNATEASALAAQPAAVPAIAAIPGVQQPEIVATVAGALAAQPAVDVAAATTQASVPAVQPTVATTDGAQQPVAAPATVVTSGVPAQPAVAPTTTPAQTNNPAAPATGAPDVAAMMREAVRAGQPETPTAVVTKGTVAFPTEETPHVNPGSGLPFHAVIAAKS